MVKKKTHKPKAMKVKYVTRYVKQKETNPLGDVNKMVGTGVTAIVGISVAGAIAKALK